MSSIDAAKFQIAYLDDIVAAAKGSPGGYAGEVLKSPHLSVGVYTVSASAIDDQTFHSEDEVYYVVRGRASFRVAGVDEPVRPGSLLFVGAGTDHRFHEIAEDLVLVVFWALPEG